MRVRGPGVPRRRDEERTGIAGGVDGVLKHRARRPPAEAHVDHAGDRRRLHRPARVINMSFGGGTPSTVLRSESTRLNSSHDQTSYAVFCLKKKKPTGTTLLS